MLSKNVQEPQEEKNDIILKASLTSTFKLENYLYQKNFDRNFTRSECLDYDNVKKTSCSNSGKRGKESIDSKGLDQSNKTHLSNNHSEDLTINNEYLSRVRIGNGRYNVTNETSSDDKCANQEPQAYNSVSISKGGCNNIEGSGVNKQGFETYFKKKLQANDENNTGNMNSDALKNTNMDEASKKTTYFKDNNQNEQENINFKVDDTIMKQEQIFNYENNKSFSYDDSFSDEVNVSKLHHDNESDDSLIITNTSDVTLDYSPLTSETVSLTLNEGIKDYYLLDTNIDNKTLNDGKFNEKNSQFTDGTSQQALKFMSEDIINNIFESKDMSSEFQLSDENNSVRFIKEEDNRNKIEKHNNGTCNSDSKNYDNEDDKSLLSSAPEINNINSQLENPISAQNIDGIDVDERVNMQKQTQNYESNRLNTFDGSESREVEMSELQNDPNLKSTDSFSPPKEEKIKSNELSEDSLKLSKYKNIDNDLDNEIISIYTDDNKIITKNKNHEDYKEINNIDSSIENLLSAENIVEIDVYESVTMKKQTQNYESKGRNSFDVIVDREEEVSKLQNDTFPKSADSLSPSMEKKLKSDDILEEPSKISKYIDTGIVNNENINTNTDGNENINENDKSLLLSASEINNTDSQFENQLQNENMYEINVDDSVTMKKRNQNYESKGRNSFNDSLDREEVSKLQNETIPKSTDSLSPSMERNFKSNEIPKESSDRSKYNDTGILNNENININTDGNEVINTNDKLIISPASEINNKDPQFKNQLQNENIDEIDVDESVTMPKQIQNYESNQQNSFDDSVDRESEANKLESCTDFKSTDSFSLQKEGDFNSIVLPENPLKLSKYEYDSLNNGLNNESMDINTENNEMVNKKDKSLLSSISEINNIDSKFENQLIYENIDEIYVDESVTMQKETQNYEGKKRNLINDSVDKKEVSKLQKDTIPESTDSLSPSMERNFKSNELPEEHSEISKYTGILSNENINLNTDGNEVVNENDKSILSSASKINNIDSQFENQLQNENIDEIDVDESVTMKKQTQSFESKGRNSFNDSLGREEEVSNLQNDTFPKCTDSLSPSMEINFKSNELPEEPSEISKYNETGILNNENININTDGNEVVKENDKSLLLSASEINNIDSQFENQLQNENIDEIDVDESITMKKRNQNFESKGRNSFDDSVDREEEVSNLQNYTIPKSTDSLTPSMERNFKSNELPEEPSQISNYNDKFILNNENININIDGNDIFEKKSNYEEDKSVILLDSEINNIDLQLENKLSTENNNKFDIDEGVSIHNLLQDYENGQKNLTYDRVDGNCELDYDSKLSDSCINKTNLIDNTVNESEYNTFSTEDIPFQFLNSDEQLFDDNIFENSNESKIKNEFTFNEAECEVPTLKPNDDIDEKCDEEFTPDQLFTESRKEENCDKELMECQVILPSGENENSKSFDYDDIRIVDENDILNKNGVEELNLSILTSDNMSMRINDPDNIVDDAIICDEMNSNEIITNKKTKSCISDVEKKYDMFPNLMLDRDIVKKASNEEISKNNDSTLENMNKDKMIEDQVQISSVSLSDKNIFTNKAKEDLSHSFACDELKKPFSTNLKFTDLDKNCRSEINEPFNEKLKSRTNKLPEIMCNHDVSNKHCYNRSQFNINSFGIIKSQNEENVRPYHQLENYRETGYGKNNERVLTFQSTHSLNKDYYNVSYESQNEPKPVEYGSKLSTSKFKNPIIREFTQKSDSEKFYRDQLKDIKRISDFDYKIPYTSIPPEINSCYGFSGSSDDSRSSDQRYNKNSLISKLDSNYNGRDYPLCKNCFKYHSIINKSEIISKASNTPEISKMKRTDSVINDNVNNVSKINLNEPYYYDPIYSQNVYDDEYKPKFQKSYIPNKINKVEQPTYEDGKRLSRKNKFDAPLRQNDNQGNTQKTLKFRVYCLGKLIYDPQIMD